MVLVKRYDEQGFVFFTNYESRKGRELARNPRAALLFYWDALGRQVRIEGAVRRTTAEESAAVRAQPAAGQPAERARVTAEPPGAKPGSAASSASRRSRPRTKAPSCRSRRVGRVSPRAREL